MKTLRWLITPLEWLIDRILDGLCSGPHGGTQRPARPAPERDPRTGRWVEADPDPEYDDNGRLLTDEDEPE